MYALYPTGYFGPLTARIRGLFVKHTRTGNPLVDSVAEHQATPVTVYWQYYHFVAFSGPIGFAASFFNHCHDAKVFALTYSLVGAYFSSKMIRLVLLLSPGACVMASGSFASISAACGVTPHAQKTGCSPSRTSTCSPQSGGSDRSLAPEMPSSSGLPQ